MSFDKAKAMRVAERHLSTGKVRNAIEEYCQIVENDPKDFNSLNMLGDLYVRVQERDEAVNCFTLLADHYNRQGFAQKAIAMYNKVARLSPDSPEVSYKLAPLYQTKGLISEARSHYLVVADAFQKNGKRQDALEIWTRIAELDPHDTEIYLKVAEGYWQLDQKEESAKAYNEAGRRFLRRKQLESASAAFSRSLEINPLDKDAFEGNIQTQLILGHYDDALSAVKNAIADQPHNIEILRLLVKCLVESGNAAEAEKETIVLVEKDPSSYRLFLDIIELYLRKNETDAASRSLSIIFEHLWANGQFDDIQRLIDEILSRNPEQLTALRLLVAFHGYQQEENKQKAALERLAESANLNNSVEDEFFALSRLAVIAPQEKQFTERLAEIQATQPNFVADVSKFSFDSGVEYQPNANSNVPSFESFEQLSKDQEEVAFSFSPIENGLDDQFEQNGFTVENSAPPEFESEISEGFFETNTIENPEAIESHFENADESTFESETLTGSVEFSDNSAADIVAADESPFVEDEVETKVVVALSATQTAHLVQELESVDYYIENEYFDLASETLQMLESQFGLTDEIKLRKVKLNPTEIVEEVSSEITEPGDFEEKQESSEMVSDSVEEIVQDQEVQELAKTEEAENENVGEENTEDAFAEESPEFAFDDGSENQTAEFDSGDIDKIEAKESQIENEVEAEFQFVGLQETEAEFQTNDFKYDYDELVTQETIDYSPQTGQEFADVTNSDEVFSDELNDDGLAAKADEFVWQETVENKEPEAEFQSETTSETTETPLGFEFSTTDALPVEDSENEFDSMMDNLESQSGIVQETSDQPQNTDAFNDFRNDLGFSDNDAPVNSSDYETHYDFGTAYKGMGLLDESIKEFQDAVRYVKPDDGTRKYLQCCSLLGMCFMEKEMPRVAIMWFKRGMETTNLSEEELKAINYELAMAYEKDGDKMKAIEVFTEIYAFDVEYRNVSERLNNLQN